MDWFNIIAGCASILGLFVALFVAQKVITLTVSLNKIGTDNTSVGGQTAVGSKNTQVGRDYNAR